MADEEEETGAETPQSVKV